jgi:acyl carrier protein
MVSIREKLLECFRCVFVNQSDEKLLSATPETLEGWDSTNHFLLLQVVEQEFGVRIPEKDGGELLSFCEIESYVRDRAAA